MSFLTVLFGVELLGQDGFSGGEVVAAGAELAAGADVALQSGSDLVEAGPVLVPVFA